VILLLGDCLETLKTLEDNSVDSVVTDPPYGLSFMGKKWDYDVPSADIWREVLRVLKPGGHMLAACGTRTQHRMAVKIEDAGFEVRDVICWHYGSGFPKSHNLEKATGDERFKGFGTSLKPATEFFTLARKPISESTVAKNVLKHGTGGINVDAGRIGAGSLKPVREATSALASNGKYGEGLNGSKAVADSTEGRFPANVIFDEFTAGLLDEQSGSLTSGKPGIKRGGNSGAAFGAESREPGTQMSGFGDSGGASRFFYCAKASKKDRGEGNIHPTVKPIKLMQYLIKLITPEFGVVLDPFMGSGSTGCAAIGLGFGFIGCELSAEYMEIAKRRIQSCEAAA